jgi:hypothetical protein
MIERGERLAQFSFTWPELTLAFFASAMRWAMLGLIVAGVLWVVRLASRSRGASTTDA